MAILIEEKVDIEGFNLSMLAVWQKILNVSKGYGNQYFVDDR